MTETLFEKAQRLGIQPTNNAVSLSQNSNETLLQKAQRLGIPPQSQQKINEIFNPSGGSSFPSTEHDTLIEGLAKQIGNIPKDTIEFGKGILHFFNPIENIQKVVELYKQSAEMSKEFGGLNTLIGTVKELPSATYHTLVPQFLQQTFNGDFEGARRTLQDRPIQEIAPLVLAAKGIAEKYGKGAEFDSAISTIASPITKPVSYFANKAGELAGKIGSQILGASTGTGASSIKEAAQGNEAFIKAMRGEINPDEIVNSVESGVQNIATNRRNEYLSKLKEISQNTKSLDISPIDSELHKQLNNFNIKIANDGSLDFSRSSIAKSSSARADVQGVYDTLKDWGSQPGDRTPTGIDTLKKQLGDFYSDSSSARAFVQAIKSKTSNILKSQVPGYSEMTGGYEKATQLLTDIRSATGVGGKARADTVFTKLTTAMKGDKEFRLAVLNEIKAKGAQPDLMSQIAGINMQPFVPRGLIARIADIGGAFGFLTHFFSPITLLSLLSTSPRIIGEFIRALGWSAQKTTAVIKAINNITEAGGVDVLKKAFSVLPSTVQSANQSPAVLPPKKQ